MISTRISPVLPRLAIAVGLLATNLIAGKTVYTTNSAGSPQNLNQFTAKADVYVRNETPGTYYFEVTGPSGPLLSSDDASCRLFTVSAGGVVTASCGHGVGSGLNAVQLIPFNDTPNVGGVYKVHVIPASCVTGVSGAVLTYTGSCDKSDNFKICASGCSSPVTSVISGVKYYDSNQNGVWDGGEAALQNWQINVTLSPGGLVTKNTDSSGVWSVEAEAGVTYTACEVIPGGTSWVQTGPLVGTPGTTGQCWTGAFDTSDTIGLNFGNAIAVDGLKYYDTNANGQFNSEPGINNFRILVGFCNPAVTTPCTYSPATQVVTANGGTWKLYSPLPPNGTNTFQACEIIPAGYKQTGPLYPASNGGTANTITTAGGAKCWQGTLSAVSGANSHLDFGNICLGGGNAKSQGWWKNQGNPTITDAALTFLGSLNLRNPDGSNFDPPSGSAGRTAVASFLGASTATNMASMLSAQLATVELDVMIWGTNGNQLIYAPGTTSVNPLGYGTLNTVMAEGNTELGLHAITLSGSPFRSYQEALKNAFDAAANNLNFVQPGACPVVY